MITKITSALISVLAVIILIFVLPSSASTQESSFPAQRLKTGDQVPVLEFTDIDGRQGTTADYQDWIMVFSFADRKSNKPLMEWITDAQIEITKLYPDLKIAYLSIADLLNLPSAFHGVIKPVLRAINKHAIRKLEKIYENNGISFESVTYDFVMIPDWSGYFLKIFGLSHGREYQCFIVKDNRVVTVLDSSTPEIKKKFVTAFKNIIEASPPSPGPEKPASNSGP